VLGLNRHLPDTISVRRCWSVPERFDARRYVIGKWYRYSLLLSPVRDPFVGKFCWKIHHRFDERLARRAAELLVGTHDFAAFRSSADMRTETHRTLFDVGFARDETNRELLHIDVRGNAFLHNMVRIIVGTIVDVARGSVPLERIDEAFETGKREVLGQTAPAQGLALRHIVLSPETPRTEPWPREESSSDPWPGWQHLLELEQMKIERD
jgi:tRNA pseudouridine38-40 synthase